MRLPRRLSQRLPRLPSSLRIAGRDISTTTVAGIVLIVVINVLLAIAYIWSRGGQTTHVRIEVRANETYSAYVDGRLVETRELRGAPKPGGINLSLNLIDGPPSLPKPSGIDSVRVTDLNTGELLFEEKFDDPNLPNWQERSSNTTIADGVFGVTEAAANITMAGQTTWEDIAVDVEMKNIEGGHVAVVSADGSSTVQFFIRPFRHLDQGFVLRTAGGQSTGAASPGRVEAAPSEPIKAMLAIVLRPYPYIVIGLLAGFAVVVALQYLPLPNVGAPKGMTIRGDRVAVLLALGLSLTALIATAFINQHYLQGMPHVPDAVSYIFQAKVLASGHLAADAPPVPDVFDFFFPQLIQLSDGKWASVYPFGHPLALAIGERFGAMWLIPPILGALSVMMLFAIARQFYGARVGVVAAILLVTSPFFLMNASSFMSHNTAAFFVFGSLLFLFVFRRRAIAYPLVAGICLGLLFNTRPLSAVALIPPYGALLLYGLMPAGTRIDGAKRLAAFTAGGFLMLVAFWLYNLGTTGDAFSGGYQTSGNLGEQVGFGGAHTVAAGISNEQVQMTMLVLVLNGWPVYVGLAFLLLPFILGTRRWIDWWLLTCAWFVMGAWTLYEATGLAYGPRYWYEALPFLMLLTARGIEFTAQRLTEVAGGLRRRLDDVHTVSRWPAYVLVYSIVALLVATSVYAWSLNHRPKGVQRVAETLGAEHLGVDDWQIFGVPESPPALRRSTVYNIGASIAGFGYLDGRTQPVLEDADLENALVLVKQDCPGTAWYCYGSVSWMNDPFLDGNVVYARFLENRLRELFAVYPDRKVYVLSYLYADLVPYPEEPRMSEAEPPSMLPPPDAPLGREATPPPPPPTATPPPTSPTATPTATPTRVP